MFQRACLTKLSPIFLSQFYVHYLPSETKRTLDLSQEALSIHILAHLIRNDKNFVFSYMLAYLLLPPPPTRYHLFCTFISNYCICFSEFSEFSFHLFTCLGENYRHLGNNYWISKLSCGCLSRLVTVNCHR